MGIFTTADEKALRICSNKFLTSQVLSKAKIRNPKQVLAHQPTDYKELIDLAGGLPCVAKLQRGSLGIGVMILNDELAASTSLRSFESLGVDVILQQYIETGNPKSDLRVFVVGPETEYPKIFAYKRYALDSDFRSNFSISGLGEKVEITDEEKEISINAALAVGMSVCGVDILRDHNDNEKPFVCEVNGSPGLKGIESITGENVAGAIIDYIRDNYKKKSNMKDTNDFTQRVNKLEEEIKALSDKKHNDQQNDPHKKNNSFINAINEAKEMYEYYNQ
jgi:ribosomal protein S6--L-glutamate ligase